jgi:hypothetical protein
MQLLNRRHRLGVIEEEREEDERKLNVAVAAAERMNVLVRLETSTTIIKIKMSYDECLGYILIFNFSYLPTSLGGT